LKRLLRATILLLVRLFGLPGALAAARKARSSIPTAPRILLIRPDHLGDLVLTTPILNAIKQHAPGAHITMMVGPRSSEIVARHPAIDRLIVVPFPGFQRAPQKALAPYILLLSVAKQLHPYDLAINLRPDFWWGAALIYLAGIPRRVGYALQPGKAFLTHALPFHTPELATVSNLRLTSAALQTLNGHWVRVPTAQQPDELPSSLRLQVVGQSERHDKSGPYTPLPEPFSPEAYPLDFQPTAEEQQWVAGRLKNAGIDASTPVIVIHPGTGADVKLWRNEGWSRCADALAGVIDRDTEDTINRVSTSLTFSPPARIILTGSKNERPMLEEIAGGMKTPALIVTDMTVGQLAALLGRASLVAGVDNGPLHIAVAQGTPTVQIFGPTDARIFGPWGSKERHIVVASTYRCPTCPAIPCGRLDFSPEELPEHPCVRRVTEQQVLMAIEQIMPYAKHETGAETQDPAP